MGKPMGQPPPQKKTIDEERRNYRGKNIKLFKALISVAIFQKPYIKRYVNECFALGVYMTNNLQLMCLVEEGLIDTNTSIF